MKNRIRFAITLAGAILCALPNVAMAQSGQNGDSQGGQAPPAIEGTWIWSVTPVGAFQGFIALESFTAGGVALATGTSDRLPPFAPAPTAPISPLYGSWRQLDNNTYVATLNFFIFDSLNNATEMFQNNITIQLKDNNLSGMGTACTWNITGGIIGASCSNPVPGSITITGTRLIAQGP